MTNDEYNVLELCKPPWRRSYNYAPQAIWVEALKVAQTIALTYTQYAGLYALPLRPPHFSWC